MNTFLILSFCLFHSGISSSTTIESRLDVFWLDKYGNISWEDEKARLDNFAIQLMNDPNQIGYYYVVVGKESCKGEAQARAVRAKNYLIKVRHVDWATVVWRDIGYGDDFQVSIWLAPRGKPPMYVPEYQRATENHLIENCEINVRGRTKVNPGAPNTRLERTRR